MFVIKRVYKKPELTDGTRILVDRLWPRGIKKEEAKIDYWLKEIAPSTPLRKWYAHKEGQWEEFKNRYFDELKNKTDFVKQLLDFGKKNKKVTLLYASRDEERNNALALLEILKKYELGLSSQKKQ